MEFKISAANKTNQKIEQIEVNLRKLRRIHNFYY